METNSLITIANYARMKNISSTWVYKLSKKGKVKIIKIDGVSFVDLEKSKTQIKK